MIAPVTKAASSEAIYRDHRRFDRDFGVARIGESCVQRHAVCRCPK
jgi:hypothetical protein